MGWGQAIVSQNGLEGYPDGRALMWTPQKGSKGQMHSPEGLPHLQDSVGLSQN